VSLRSSKPAPDTVLLSSDESILEAVSDDRATPAESLSSLDRFRSDLAVCNVFREVDAWEAFAGYFAGAVNFEQKLGVWVSGVDHKIQTNERIRNVLY
jgi:hypothetical protein